MIESIVLNYLSDALPDVPAYCEEPEQAETERFIIARSSLSETNYIAHATVFIWSYSESLFKASLLDERLRIAMKNITELADVSACRLENDYIDTDTDKRQYRYRAEFDITFFDVIGG